MHRRGTRILRGEVGNYEYSSLVDTEYEGTEEDVIDEFWQKLSRWAVIIILVFTAIDSAIIAYLGFLYSKQWSPPKTKNSLSVHSTYVNFDNLRFNTSRGPIVNSGFSFAQLSSMNNDKGRPASTNGSWLTENGLVPFDERRLWITSQVSTVAHFLTKDYGMEMCSLAVTIPREGDNESSITIGSLSENATLIDVWALEAIRTSSSSALSRSAKPKRNFYLGYLVASYGTTHETFRFPCPSGTFWAFELACRTDGCHVDVTSTRREASGLYMLQHEGIRTSWA